MRNPSTATFNAEAPAASWQAVTIGAAIMALAWTIFFVAGSSMRPSPYSSGPTFGSGVIIYAAFFIGFFFYIGVYQLIAKVFGGKGSFLTYAYLMSLIVVPIDTVNALVLLIPLLGIVVVFATAIYAMYLLVLATQSAHGFTGRKASAIVLTPVAVSMAFSCALSSLVMLFALAIMKSVH